MSKLGSKQRCKQARKGGRNEGRKEGEMERKEGRKEREMINRYNATNQKRKSISVITFHMMALPLGIKKGIEVTEPALTTISTELLSLANALYACTVDGIVVIHIRVNSQFEVMKENDICTLDEKS